MLSRVFFFLHLLLLSFCISSEGSSNPIPATWPEQFHAILFTNTSTGTIHKMDYWYDWLNRCDFEIIQSLLRPIEYNANWGNGTSFVFTLNPKQCRVIQVDPSPLPSPDYLKWLKYVGQEVKDGFLCNVWEDSILRYYEDVKTKKPVYWRVGQELEQHWITFEAGKVVEDKSIFQAPSYCFREYNDERKPIIETLDGDVFNGNNNMIRAVGMFNKYAFE